MAWIVSRPSFVLLPVRSSWSPHARGPSTCRQPACICHGVARQSAKGTISETRLCADRLTLAAMIIDFSSPVSPHPRDSPDPDRFFSFYSARQPTWEAGSVTGIRNQVLVHKSQRNLHQPTHPFGTRGSNQDLRYAFATPFYIPSSLHLHGQTDR